MRACEFGTKPFAGLQLMRLDHRAAITATPPSKPRQWALVLVNDNLRTASLRGHLALANNEVSCAKAVDVWLLRLRRRLFDLMFHTHVRTSNPDDQL
jgi:hypothetical protein